MKVETKMKQTNTKGAGAPKNQQKQAPKKSNDTKGKYEYSFAYKEVAKPKIEQVKYVKSFNFFSEGMNEMINISDEVYDLFQEVDYPWNDVDEAMRGILQVFTNHMPSFNHRSNMHYDLTMSANKCSLKTDKFVSFGWYIKSTKNQDGSFNTEYIFHIIVFGKSESIDALIDRMTEEGWYVDTYKK